MLTLSRESLVALDSLPRWHAGHKNQKDHRKSQGTWKMKFKTMLVVTVATTLLAACGGGGGGDSVASSSLPTSPVVNVGPPVSTLAGAGTTGFVDGVGVAAKFYSPQGVAVDSKGNVFVADGGTIRKITPAGVVSIFAGSTRGFADGVGTDAKFAGPSDVAVDSSDNVFVADDDAIRKITPAGVVSTFAGTGTSGYVDGVGVNARFSGPQGLAVDRSGNVFVADRFNGAIRKITPAGVVSTLAGSNQNGFVNGVGAAAIFSSPFDVAVDSSGNVFVADIGNSVIRKITPAGVVSTFAGAVTATTGFANGSGTAASFSSPASVAVDSSDNVFVADTSNHAIRKITPAGIVSTIAGTGTSGYVDGVGVNARFKSPYGIAVDSSGNVFVADTFNYAIRTITP